MTRLSVLLTGVETHHVVSLFFALFILIGVLSLIWCFIALWKNNKYAKFVHTKINSPDWKYYFDKWNWYVDWPWHRLPKPPKE